MKSFYRRYFEEIKEMIAWGHFDSLAHITYPDRFIFQTTGERVDEALIEDEVKEVLIYLIEAEKALEVNSAGMRRRLCMLSADIGILKLYKQLGGRLVTIGSDAHTCSDIGSHFDCSLEALKKAGFHEYVTYEKRKPIFREIG